MKNTSKDILGYVRTAMVDGSEQNVYVFLNFGKKIVKFNNPVNKARLLASTSINSDPIQNENIVLNPQEGVVLISLLD